jgi:vacuolar-type H+-ATPase subunit E/Vma4
VRAALEARIGKAATDATYLGALAREVSEGLARLPDGPVVVRARPELLKPIERVLGRDDRVALEASPGLGVGFTATVAAEGVELDGTLVTRLEHAWPRLAVAVLRDAST